LRGTIRHRRDQQLVLSAPRAKSIRVMAPTRAFWAYARSDIRARAVSAAATMAGERRAPRVVPSGAATEATHAIEFREPSWYSDEVFALLSQHVPALPAHPARVESFHGFSGTSRRLDA